MDGLTRDVNAIPTGVCAWVQFCQYGCVIVVCSSTTLDSSR